MVITDITMKRIQKVIESRNTIDPDSAMYGTGGLRLIQSVFSYYKKSYSGQVDVGPDSLQVERLCTSIGILCEVARAGSKEIAEYLTESLGMNPAKNFDYDGDDLKLHAYHRMVLSSLFFVMNLGSEIYVGSGVLRNGAKHKKHGEKQDYLFWYSKSEDDGVCHVHSMDMHAMGLIGTM